MVLHDSSQSAIKPTQFILLIQAPEEQYSNTLYAIKTICFCFSNTQSLFIFSKVYYWKALWRQLKNIVAQKIRLKNIHRKMVIVVSHREKRLRVCWKTINRAKLVFLQSCFSVLLIYVSHEVLWCVTSVWHNIGQLCIADIFAITRSWLSSRIAVLILWKTAWTISSSDPFHT